MTYKLIITLFVLLLTVSFGSDSAWAKIVVHSLSTVDIELLGYNGLNDNSIFKGGLKKDNKTEINTPYHGLALLVFDGGQRYPVIIGNKSFTLKIADPNKPPSFKDSPENNFFYKSLSGGDTTPEQYAFALLMIQAKNLLESSASIKTVKELKTKKKEFHEFIDKHYDNLKHSDMVRRLIAQYFMMHEYVDYHTEKLPATDIRVYYQKEIMDGVGNWIKRLKPHLPKQEILNYCVSLYYNRSMVTLASQIINNFSNIASCSGEKKESFSFPGNLIVVESGDALKRKLSDIKGNKVIAFVSEDCPVSMVETVVKARELAAKREKMPVIVAPLQKLSGNHLNMARMVHDGNILFINDEKWRKENLPEKIKLPLFVRLGDSSDK